MGKIVTLKELKNIRSELRLNSLKVVFTNGVFDIIHRGHVEYLQKAKSLGNVLVVGLNSDASVRRIKGDKRPIVNQDDRAFVLSNLLMVDYVCLFEEDTPLQLISELVPDVLVKGSDWDINDIVGRDVVEKNGGKVETIEFVPERSSTNIVDTIINRYCKGQ
ncbi:MAG: D-glycero-beta-D-manno-heptose 1-phosphate adenylyltransferase [Bacteroidetes bacterium]|jgi:D-beta-D-heptose 7-phosphate kinase/D-beta-D-heptose 1-phosphate adenosyltransferase|nr:D-glycero-beta-D-manno-heptose 1-phosphate adenylyltransferase [Bacteroidota bacterium]MBU1421939.1 D-glycero-beta-D-manno-heptose 1-phosphate adenylyltransferase [Bacteroidota bacterium]MBU2471357.1 D-glycero-beta-D-manno-heptose 1-phosphate adenylyltransferase [Bacteroidota bacterium]